VFRIRAIALITAMLNIIGVFAAPSVAAEVPASVNKTEVNDPCPLVNGPGDVLQTGVSKSLLVGGSVENVAVLKDGVEADIVCAKAKQGVVFINDDHTISYVSGMIYEPVLGIDTVTIGVVGTDGQYHSETVKFNTVTVYLPTPVVVKKAKLNKRGKVVKPALVEFTNLTPDYNLQVMAGNFNEPQPDTIRWIMPGETVRIKTRRPLLDFMQSVTKSSPKAKDAVLLYVGTADTIKGTVQMLPMWSEDGSSKRVTAKLGTALSATKKWPLS